jgi:hypothetical protein
LLSRCIAVTLSGVTLALGVLSAAPAHAGGCGTFSPCGEVQNNSGTSVYVTTEWGTSDAERWGASDLLLNGAHAGGGSVDIDGFYVNNRCRVWARMDGQGSDYWAYGPLWHKVGNLTTAVLSGYTCE